MRTTGLAPVARSRGRDAGAGTLEHVAAVALAGVLLVAFVLYAWGGLPAAAVRGICTVEQALGVAGRCADPTAPTPYEQAVSGRYVAMGDSYSSGEGASDYEPGTDFDDRDDLWPFNNDEELHNRCHRSADAYARILGGNNTFADGSTFVACSGSVISDFDQPNHKDTGEKPQTDALGDDVSLVTLTLGGNDLHFAQVVQDCIANGEGGAPFLKSCQEKHDREIALQLPQLRARLMAEYQEIHRKAPDARIVVVGYPQLFLDDPHDRIGDMLFAADQRWMNEKGAQLNATLAQAAADSGAEFVDPTDAFRGHNIGSSDPWINDLTLGGPGWMPADPGSFHPNATGHAALARLIQEQLEHPRH